MWRTSIQVGVTSLGLATFMLLGSAETQECLQPAFEFEIGKSHRGWVEEASLSQSGDLLAARISFVPSDYVLLMESRTGRVVRRFPGSARFSPTGDLLAVATSSWFSIQRLGQMSSEPISLKYPQELSHAPFLVGFTHDGEFLLARTFEDDPSETVVLWRVTDQQIIAKHRLEGVVNFAAMSTSGRLVAWHDGASNTLQVTNVDTGKTTRRLRTRKVHPELSSWIRVRFLPGDKLLTVLHYDEVFRIWDLQSGKPVFEKDLYQEDSRGYPSVWGLVVDRLGRYAATASQATGLNRTRLILWDLEKRKKVSEAYGTQLRVLGFSGDGKILAVWELVPEDDGSPRVFCRFYRVEDMVACGSR